MLVRNESKSIMYECFLSEAVDRDILATLVSFDQSLFVELIFCFLDPKRYQYVLPSSQGVSRTLKDPLRSKT